MAGGVVALAGGLRLMIRRKTGFSICLSALIMATAISCVFGAGLLLVKRGLVVQFKRSAPRPGRAPVSMASRTLSMRVGQLFGMLGLAVVCVFCLPGVFMLRVLCAQ